MARTFANFFFRGGGWTKSAKTGAGALRLGPTFSNRGDCRRYGCPETPWHWGTRWVLERAGLTGKETVVDLGAGDNPMVIAALREKAARAFLVDNLLLPERDPGHHVVRIAADISRLPLADESVDVVISISVLEYLPLERRFEAQRETARVLKPGGRAVHTIGVPVGVTNGAAALMATLPYFTERNCPLFVPIDVRRLLAAAPDLRPADADGLAACPGFDGFDEDRLLGDEDVLFVAYADYPELAEYPGLQPVRICELGLMLVK